jgi:hypothetical protein
MKKFTILFKTLMLILVFTTVANISFATDYVTVASGDASNGANWQGGVAPSSFGGSGGSENSITIAHQLYFNNDYKSDNSLAIFTVNAGAVLVTKDFSLLGNDKTLVINGVLICFGLAKETNVTIEGDGTLITEDIQSDLTPPPGMTVYNGVYYWTGGNDEDWQNSSNWLNSALPASNSFVGIGPAPLNMPLINSAEQIGGLAIAYDQFLTLSPSGSLTVGKINLYNGGSLNIFSNATGAGSLITSEIPLVTSTSTFNVLQYLSGTAKWHIISSPVNGQQMGLFSVVNSLRTNPSAPADRALAPLNVTADNWSPFTSADNTTFFESGKGYMASNSVEGAVIFTGNSINTGTMNYTLETGGNRWNAVGNPYTSAILAKGTGSFLAENTTVLDPAFVGIYVWDHSLSSGTGDYQVISNGGFTFPGPGGESELNQTHIAVGQGFVVRSSVTGGTVNFKASMQQHATNTTFKSAEKSVPAFRLTVKSGTLVNNTIVSFENGKTTGLDAGYDVGKLKGNTNIALYTKLVDGSSDTDFAVQSLPDAEFELRVIPVGLDLKSGGKTTFSLETVSFPENAKVYLEDKGLNTRTLLNAKDAEYSVTLSETKGYGRFNLLVADFNKSNVTTNLTTVEKPEFNVYTRDNAIFINGNIERGALVALYGIDGKVRYSNKAESAGLFRIDASNLPTGIYLLKINQKGGQFTQKVVLTGN